MKTLEWDPSCPLVDQLRVWCQLAAEPGLVHVVFDGPENGESIGWREIEDWTRSRAVTVTELRSSLGHGALDAALCADLVYLRSEVELRPGGSEPSAGLLWALGRAGRPALSRALLDENPIRGAEAVRLGLALGVLGDGESVPATDGVSMVALTTARDLMRSSGRARSSLELASFRLLFSSGAPGEGAKAFLERRRPDFD